MARMVTRPCTDVPAGGCAGRRRVDLRAALALLPTRSGRS